MSLNIRITMGYKVIENESQYQNYNGIQSN